MSLDADVIRDAVRDQLGSAAATLETLEVFAEIESTNSYLMQQAGPSEGQVRVAVTDNQTAGRGRHGRSWQSPSGSGLCLSLAYTFASTPDNLPAVTLAVGLGVVDALKQHRVEGVQLKWPNDLVAADGKLGGVLTEAHLRSRTVGALTVVTGVGLNIDLSRHPALSVETDWAKQIVDLKSYAGIVPDSNALASSLVAGLTQLLVDYEVGGFGQFRDRWQQHDWLRGRTVVIETPQQNVSGMTGKSGIVVGIADDGALLIDTPADGVQRITAGTVALADVARSNDLADLARRAEIAT